MNNKFLVRVYVPTIEMSYEVFLPPTKRIDNVIDLLVKAVHDFSKGYYTPSARPSLFNKNTSQRYGMNQDIIDTDIRNGTELILI